MTVFEIALGLVVFVLALVLFNLPSFRRTKRVVLDGSNILYWDDNQPALGTVKSVVTRLQADGYAPVVYFDANVGYLVSDRYLGPKALARRLGMEEKAVHVAEKGTPADPLVIKSALRFKARIVTNDRFRDWEEDFPQVQDKALFVRGNLHGGTVHLRF